VTAMVTGNHTMAETAASAALALMDTGAYRKSNPDILVVQPAESWAAMNAPG